MTTPPRERTRPAATPADHSANGTNGTNGTNGNADLPLSENAPGVAEAVAINAEISDEKARQITEEFESESPTRSMTGAWRIAAGVLSAALAIYALYWTQYNITTQLYRSSFLMLTLVLSFLLYPMYRAVSNRSMRFGLPLLLLGVVALWLVGSEGIRANVTVVDYACVLALLIVAAAIAIAPLALARGGDRDRDRERAAIRSERLYDLALAVVGAIGLWVAGHLALEATLRDSVGLEGQTGRSVALVVALAASAGLFALFVRNRGKDSVKAHDVQLTLMVIASLGYLALNYESALQRVTRPTVVEVALGAFVIVLALEATRRTSGWALPITAALFLVYARLGPVVPEPFDHRGYTPERIIGQNYLTLEGIFGVPLDVAATYIVLFTIYGAILEYSGAGKFFLDWSFAALGKSRSGTGPGRTVTAAGFLLGTVSGSGVATTVTLGSLAWPMLRRAGYKPDIAGGLLSAAGIGATLSPPTLGAAAFIIAEYLKVSYLQVLVYATIPTLLYYLSCLLMMEADARRMRTRAVTVQTEPIWELTKRYGYHFSSLFAIVIFLGIGMTPFLAVFWSIVIAFALSFIRPETRLTSLGALAVGAVVALFLFLATGMRDSEAVFWAMMIAAGIAALLVAVRRVTGREIGGSAGQFFGTNSRFLQALESGGRGVLSVAAATATAGVIVSVVTLTGLGLKISGLIVDLSGGVLFFTVLLAAIAVWVLGLAVPVTASYIIAAVMIVPALTSLGVPAPAAHMFIFYYAVLADVSPPTALAPFAAAAITGGSPFRTTMIAWKYCLPAFLVPFMFTLSPEGVSLLLIGDPLTIAVTFVTGCIAIAALAVTCGGYLLREANAVERVLACVGGLLLLYADIRTDIAGLVVLAAVVTMHVLRTRGMRDTPDTPALGGAD